MEKTVAPLSDSKMTTKLLFRLLPVQILLVAIGAINGIVSGIFASNFVGSEAMSAVGLYTPVTMLLGAIGTMLTSGSVIICGKYMGKNQVDQMQNVFTVDMILSTLVAFITAAILLVMGVFDLTAMIAPDEAVRPVFNLYIIGQAIGAFPFLIANQLSAFLSLENKTTRTTIASLVYVVINILLNFIFVQAMHLEALGLALASALGMWIFMLIQAQYFFSGKSALRLNFKNLRWDEGKQIIGIGFPGAINYGYQTLRGFIINALIMAYVFTPGMSSFTASEVVMRLFWSIPGGMMAVSRMMMSVSIGEEDRTTLTNVMRCALFKFVPLQLAVSLFMAIMAKPFTMIFFQDPTVPEFMMTVWGFRIIPLCMPLSVIVMHFQCYAQASGKNFLVHLIAIFDGVLCMALFTALLIPHIGIHAVYVANILNGITCVAIILIYSIVKNKHMPRNMDELMVISEDFGVDEDHRLELYVHDMEDVVGMSKKVQDFCAEKGVDKRRSYLTSLSMEEMTGNVVLHGFSMDEKKHNLSARTIVKDEDVILCIKDDCKPFDPVQRQRIADPEDKTHNIGIRMVNSIAKDFTYQNVLGLNVLTIKI
jgi:Na+-driven multidrug efflux pump/anti-sigma regulatory factor (Ser/Thr protein kinase)